MERTKLHNGIEAARQSRSPRRGTGKLLPLQIGASILQWCLLVYAHVTQKLPWAHFDGTVRMVPLQKAVYAYYDTDAYLKRHHLHSTDTPSCVLHSQIQQMSCLVRHIPLQYFHVNDWMQRMLECSDSTPGQWHTVGIPLSHYKALHVRRRPRHMRSETSLLHSSLTHLLLFHKALKVQFPIWFIVTGRQLHITFLNPPHRSASPVTNTPFVITIYFLHYKTTGVLVVPCVILCMHIVKLLFSVSYFTHSCL